MEWARGILIIYFQNFTLSSLLIWGDKGQWSALWLNLTCHTGLKLYNSIKNHGKKNQIFSKITKKSNMFKINKKIKYFQKSTKSWIFFKNHKKSENFKILWVTGSFLGLGLRPTQAFTVCGMTALIPGWCRAVGRKGSRVIYHISLALRGIRPVCSRQIFYFLGCLGQPCWSGAAGSQSMAWRSCHRYET